MVEITEEMVEAAAKGTFAERHRGTSYRWDDMGKVTQNAYREHARAALAAALPLIEAAVREQHQRNLRYRDDFIVSRGLWMEFVEGLPLGGCDHE